MKKQTLLAVVAGLSITLAGCTNVMQNNQNTEQNQNVEQTQNLQLNNQSKIETLNYSINYEGTDYSKSVSVYVPEGYKQGEPMNILYIMHGSTGDAEGTADALKPLLDTLIKDGKIKPMLVAFPTYYPDRSFVTSNYSRDYPLNNFFATTEVDKVIEIVESSYTTFAKDTSQESLRESREHRAFGGYSMGGITTWDTLVNKADYFYYYLPMAGDSWIGRITNDSSAAGVANTLVSGLEENNYGANDFKIIAMVGERDGTKNSMIPQINALRNNHTNLINDKNLLYYENTNGGHDLNSFIVEVDYGVQRIFDK